MEARNKEERKRNTRLMMALCCCVLCSFSFILAFTSFVPHSRYIEMNEKRTKGTGIRPWILVVVYE